MSSEICIARGIDQHALLEVLLVVNFIRHVAAAEPEVAVRAAHQVEVAGEVFDRGDGAIVAVEEEDHQVGVQELPGAIGMGFEDRVAANATPAVAVDRGQIAHPDFAGFQAQRTGQAAAGHGIGDAAFEAVDIAELDRIGKAVAPG